MACKAQSVLDHVSNKEMTELTRNASGITNLPFHALTVVNADTIYGKDLGGVMGKLRERNQNRLGRMELQTSPRISTIANDL